MDTQFTSGKQQGNDCFSPTKLKRHETPVRVRKIHVLVVNDDHACICCLNAFVIVLPCL